MLGFRPQSLFSCSSWLYSTRTYNGKAHPAPSARARHMMSMLPSRLLSAGKSPGWQQVAFWKKCGRSQSDKRGKTPETFWGCNAGYADAEIQIETHRLGGQKGDRSDKKDNGQIIFCCLQDANTFNRISSSSFASIFVQNIFFISRNLKSLVKAEAVRRS